MEAIMAMGLGDKLNVVGFCFTLLGALMGLVGIVLMFVGSGLTGEGIWQNLKKVQHMAEQASVRHEAQWSIPMSFPLANLVPSTASHALLGYTMKAVDTRTPLDMRITSKADGSGIQTHASGSSGQLSIMLEGMVLYVSVSHPSIEWELYPKGYKDDLSV